MKNIHKNCTEVLVLVLRTIYYCTPTLVANFY
jgi:hypothetical protein